MKFYEYSAKFEPGQKKGVIVVTFSDVPEAITQGRSILEAEQNASDALCMALLSYPLRGLPVPRPKARTGKKINVPADVAAKLAVLEAYAVSKLSKAELARRLQKDEREIRRILDPLHATKLSTLVEALSVLGRRMIVGIKHAA